MGHIGQELSRWGISRRTNAPIAQTAAPRRPWSLGLPICLRPARPIFLW